MTRIAFIGIDFFTLLFCMMTKERTIRQVVGIINRGRCNCSGQDKAVVNINGGMLIKAKVGDIVFDSPV
jgi:hypothetical protein